MFFPPAESGIRTHLKSNLKINVIVEISTPMIWWAVQRNVCNNTSAYYAGRIQIPFSRHISMDWALLFCLFMSY